MTGNGPAGRDAAVLALPGPEPTAPQVSPIQAVHRHADGVISFHRKNADGSFENLFAIRAEHLQGMFPEFQSQLEADSFYSVNAFFHPEGRRRRLNAIEARQRDRVRYLCAVYVDLDSYKVDMDFGAALGAIISRQEKGLLPPASVFVRSGQGLWVLWILRDQAYPALPQRAWPEKIRKYLEINRAVGERLANLGADPAARDIMRLTRVPGSVHSGVCKRVKYWIQSGDGIHPVTYTLDELADAFGVEAKLDPASERAFAAAALPPGSRKRGHAQLNARRLREFGNLRSKRGRFVNGCRNHACLIYGWLLRRNGLVREAVLREVETLGRECQPPLDQSSIRAAVKSAFGRAQGRIKDQTIADWLDVTPDEAEFMEKLPAASRFRVVDVTVIEPLSPEQRHRLIRGLIDRAGGVPTCRRMAELLAVEGHNVSYVQVLRDYRALNIETGRERQSKMF